MFAGSKIRVSLLVGTATLLPTSAFAQSIETIVVTASRRETSVLDVPYNISAYTGDELKKSHVSDLSDFAKIVPGLSYVDPGPRLAGNNNEFIMRGLNAASTQGLDVSQFAIPTVSTYLGETPVFFNVQSTDLERVEVLRGPQGTLYGAGSLSGTIRFIPNPPELGRFYASGTADVSGTDHSSAINDDEEGVLNVPIGDKVAFRISGGYSFTAGFIDQTNLAVLGQNGVPEITGPLLDPATTLVTQRKKHTNDAKIAHLRAALAADITPKLHVELHYNYQHTSVGDRQADNPFFPGNSDWQASSRLLSPLQSNVHIAGLDAKWDLNFATLTSATSYTEITTRSVEDDSGFYSLLPSAFYFGYPRFVVPDNDAIDEHSFSQEVRLASNGTEAIDWLLGAFYNRQIKQFESVDQADKGLAEYTATILGAPVSNFLVPSFVNNIDVHFEDIALFGELTWHITRDWQITGGARQFWENNDGRLFTALPYCAATGGGCPPVTATNNDSLSSQVFRANTSYAIDALDRVYATFSQGFRPGGANAVPTTGPFAVSPQNAFYKPDRTNNYEVGAKGTIAAWDMDYSVAAYHIDWTNIQFDGFVTGGFNAVLNGSTAKSQGVEIEFSGRVGSQLTYNVGYAYTDAELTKSFAVPSGSNGSKGNPLPGAPRNTFNFAADYTQPIGRSYSIDYHVDGAFKDSTVSIFNPTNAGFFPMSSFFIFDAAVTLSSQNWAISLYGQNLADTRAVFGGTPSDVFGDQGFFLVNRPRTVGIRLSAATE